MEMNIVIEPNATVAIHSSISLEKTSLPESISTNQVTVVIAGGNVFHPFSELLIIPPQSSEARDSDNTDEIKVRIGENNLFEEGCKVVLDLNTDQISGIGSYNQFAPLCHVQATRIGNGNVFESKSRVSVTAVQNGSIFSLFVQIWDSDIEYDNKMAYVLKGKTQLRNRRMGMIKTMENMGLLLAAHRKIVQRNHRLMTVSESIK